MNRLPPTDFIAEQVFDLRVGQHFDAQATRRRLEAAGYRCVETVYEHGEYALRGSVMDISPPVATHPTALIYSTMKLNPCAALIPKASARWKKSMLFACCQRASIY